MAAFDVIVAGPVCEILAGPATTGHLIDLSTHAASQG